MQFEKINYHSPLGLLSLSILSKNDSEEFLLSCRFVDEVHEVAKTPPTAHFIAPLCAQLDAYFTGQLKQFDSFPLLLAHGTVFQKRVWQALQHIPYGETTSYGAIAKAVGKPKAVRAVANAIGNNPFLILVPCHRVLRQNGQLSGYRGGSERKAWLLQHEQQFAKTY